MSKISVTLDADVIFPVTSRMWCQCKDNFGWAAFSH